MSDLADAHGTIRTFDEWAERNGDRLAVELTDDAFAAKVDIAAPRWESCVSASPPPPSKP